jgi:hypothetical protein
MQGANITPCRCRCESAFGDGASANKREGEREEVEEDEEEDEEEEEEEDEEEDEAEEEEEEREEEEEKEEEEEEEEKKKRKRAGILVGFAYDMLRIRTFPAMLGPRGLMAETLSGSSIPRCQTAASRPKSTACGSVCVCGRPPCSSVSHCPSFVFGKLFFGRHFGRQCYGALPKETAAAAAASDKCAVQRTT